MIVQPTLFPTTDHSNDPDPEGSDQWYTPQQSVNLIKEVYGGEIDFDCCANPRNTVGATHYMTQSDNCLTSDWNAPGDVLKNRIYQNPPYSNTAPFLSRLCEYLQFNSMATAITLTKEGSLFNDSTQDIFKNNCLAMCLVKARLKFWNPVKNKFSKPNFDVVFGYWGDDKYLANFREKFISQGMIVKPCIAGWK